LGFIATKKMKKYVFLNIL